MLRQLLVSVLLIVYLESSVAQDIVPSVAATTNKKRKDPTADLPDLSKDELVAILDLIEKSGDSSGKIIPPRYPSSRTTAAPLYPQLPSAPEPPRMKDERTSESPNYPPPTPRPFSYPDSTERPPVRPQGPTDYPTRNPAYQPTPPNYPAPIAPPNYPAPIAPPTPTTTPKPKKSFFEKLYKGIIKVIAPQSASGNPTSASPANYLTSFLQQLQNANQGSGDISQRKPETASSGNVLNNLVNRLQGQQGEGSQFVVNLIKTLQNPDAPTPASTAQSGQTQSNGSNQLIGALIRSIGNAGQKSGDSSSSGGSFLESFQREILRNAAPSSSQPNQNTKSTSDVLVDGFKQLLQQQFSKN